MKKLWLCSALVFALSMNAYALTVSGTITDAVTGKPISGVLVQADKYEGRYPGFTTSVTTNASGQYSMNYTPTAISTEPAGYYQPENPRFSIYTLNGRQVRENAGQQVLAHLGNTLAAGMYLVMYEIDGEVSLEKLVITGAGNNVPVIRKNQALKLAAVAGLQTDTLLSFSKDGYTTQGLIKEKNSYNIKLYPRTAIGTKPGPGNTGPTGPLKLGGGSVIKAGQTAEGYYFSGALTISADNVTLRNFIINGNGLLYAVQSNSPGITLEDGEIVNAGISGTNGNNIKARRVNIHDHGDDGLKAGTGLDIQYCWIHHLGINPKAHADGVQFGGGGKSVFKYNNFDMPITDPAPYKSNATLLIQPHSSPIDDVLIEGNWLNGGNYTLYARDKGIGYPTNVRVIKNKFGRDKRYGLLSGQVAVWSGNVWEDNGQPAQ